MKIRTVTLDFWGTLLHDGPASDNRYRAIRVSTFHKILTADGYSIARGGLERGYDASATFLATVWGRHRDVPVETHVKAMLAGADPKLPDRVSAATIAKLVDAYARPALLVPPALDPGTPGALVALRERGLTLAVVSNTMRTPGVSLRKLLAQFGILEHFAHTTFSDEVGVRKPAAEIFELTLRAVGGEPASTVHVGDDLVLDVEGAHGLGIRAIQVLNSPPPRTSRVEPDLVIPRMAALPAAVDLLETR